MLMFNYIDMYNYVYLPGSGVSSREGVGGKGVAKGGELVHVLLLLEVVCIVK